MSWAETVYITKHLDKKLNDIESRLPFVAKNVDGLPEGIDIEKLKPGAIWYIEDEDSIIRSYSIFNNNKIFSNPISLNVEWN